MGKANKVLMVFIGIMLIYYGINMAISTVTWRGVVVSPWVGYFAIPIGIITLIGGFVSKPKDPDKEIVACPHCGTAHPKTLAGQPCPKCGAPLEPLGGFYERHPELQGDPLAGEDTPKDV